MNAFSRQTIAAAAIVALAVTTGSAQAQIQMNGRGNQGENLAKPNPAAPNLLIPTIRSTSDARLGIDLAAELRKQLGKNPKDLWVVPRQHIAQMLSTSGFNPDSAYSANDVKDLGKNLSAVETIDGIVSRTASGVKFEPRFYFNNNLNFVEFFPAVEGKTVADVAAKFADTYRDMRKQLPATKQCQSALRAEKNDSAVVYGRAIVALYPTSNVGRLCILSGFAANPKMADSTIKYALEIYHRDSTSQVALPNLLNAYFAKGDKEKSVEYGMKLLALDPTNTDVAKSVIATLVSSGSAERALPIIKQLEAINPGDPEVLASKWKLQLQLRNWKEAVKAADELVKYDTSAATLDFYERMIGVAQSDSQPQLVMQYLAKATKKFPKAAQLQLFYSGELGRAGQLQQALDAAKLAVAADPKIPGGMVQVVSLYAKLNMNDSAYAFAKQAIAAGADQETVGQALLATLSAANTKAQASQARADWEELLKSARQVDSIVPSSGSKFFIGLSAAYIAVPALQAASEASTARPANMTAACSEVNIAEQMLLLAQQSIGPQGGGKFNTEAAAAIMQQVVLKYQTTPAEMKKQFRCK